MTTGINNIDKFLQDLFQNFRVKPSSDSWRKIADALDNTNPKDALIPKVDQIGTLYKGYKVTPSEKVWQNIYKILESDKYTSRKLAKSAVSAIIAFFSNTTTAVVTSVAVVAGVSFLFLNPFKDDSTKLAAYETPKHIEAPIKSQSAIRNQQSDILHKSEINNPKSAILHKSAIQNPKSAILHKSDILHKSEINNPKPAILHKSEINNPQSEILHKSAKLHRNSPIETKKKDNLKDNSQSNSIKTPQLIADNNGKSKLNDNRLSKYPPIKFSIRQNRSKYNKMAILTIDLQKKMDELIDRFYRQWAKKFKRHRDEINVEAYYLQMYGSTTFIAHQINTPSLSRSYNEFVIGTSTNFLGLNLSLNYNKYTFEAGAMYGLKQTRRNDDLTWISYDPKITIKKDSFGFIFNTVDSTFHTLYKTTIDTSYTKNELRKNYRSTMTYKTIDVPLLIGYKLIDKRNNLVVVRTGILASFNIQTAEEKMYNDESVKPYIIYPDRKQVDFSYVVNLSYDFNMKDNFKISVTPTFRYNITGMYKGFEINKGPATFGLGLGIKYSF